MSIVMKSYIFTIVRINTRSDDNGTTKVSPNVLSNNCWITFVWVCIYVETILVFFITFGFNFFGLKKLKTVYG